MKPERFWQLGFLGMAAIAVTAYMKPKIITDFVENFIPANQLPIDINLPDRAPYENVLPMYGQPTGLPNGCETCGSGSGRIFTFGSYSEAADWLAKRG